MCLFQGPFFQRNELPRKDPPGSSCSPLLQTCLLSTAQRHRPLEENVSWRFHQDLLSTVAPTDASHWWWFFLLCGMSSARYTFSDSVAQRRVAPAGSSRLLSMSSWSSFFSLFSVYSRQDNGPVNRQICMWRRRENIFEVCESVLLLCWSYRRLVSRPDHKQADFEVTFGP